MATATQRNTFIANIAPLIQKYAKERGYSVCSPVIAQACLESAYGTSELATNAHNYFGLKYRAGRCKTCTGIYYKVGSEQNADGSYTSSTMKWCQFSDMENGVIGYYDFISISNYANLKGVSDPETYLKNIKADGYATSLKYVENLMKVITENGLTKYDVEEVANMSNSSLVAYTKISPNKTSPRNKSIDRITPHCVVGQVTVESLGNIFAPTSKKASSNYGIGKDGKIGMYVEESDRSWCSSNAANDNRAVTIECASDTSAPYTMNAKVYASLVTLCTDICKRNGKSKLIWIDDKAKALAYTCKSDEMLITVHRWFANKSCPGDWLYSRLGNLASEVTANLGGKTTTTTTTTSKTTSSTSYTVKVTASALNIRSTPSTAGKITGCIRDKGIYTIVEESNGWGKLKSGKGWISLKYTERV